MGNTGAITSLDFYEDGLSHEEWWIITFNDECWCNPSLLHKDLGLKLVVTRRTSGAYQLGYAVNLFFVLGDNDKSLYFYIYFL